MDSSKNNIEKLDSQEADTHNNNTKQNKKKKRKRKRVKKQIEESSIIINKATDSPNKNSSGQTSRTKRQKKQQLLLQGMVLSVSTLKGEVEKDDINTTSSTNPLDTGYSAVAQLCQELGAQVIGQVSKRVQLLVCTKSAVDQPTQRVRKAFQKKIPIVDIQWLQECQQAEGKMMLDITPFRLEGRAKIAIAKREDNLQLQQQDNQTETKDISSTDVGWSEPVSFGCSCVCHENGSEKDCPWCTNGCGA